MSLRLRALQGVVWSALASWLQLLLGLATFFTLAHYVNAVSFGTFGAAMLVTVAADTLLGPTLTQSLEQRPTLRREQVDATLFYAVVLSIGLTGALVAGAPFLTRIAGVPGRRRCCRRSRSACRSPRSAGCRPRCCHG